MWSVFLWYEDLHKENPELVFFTILESRIRFNVQSFFVKWNNYSAHLE